MYQLEVKAALVARQFPRSAGWSVTVDIDAMERAKGGVHAAGKQERVAVSEREIRESGATIGAHPRFGRADIVAEHATLGTVIVEVEGESSRQREQAVYSALGQALLNMRVFDGSISYAIAVPHQEDWVRQLRKVPGAVARRLNLRLLAVSASGVEEVVSEIEP